MMLLSAEMLAGELVSMSAIWIIFCEESVWPFPSFSHGSSAALGLHLDALPLRERVACPSIDSPMERRHRMLRNIAAAAGRSVIADAIQSAPTHDGSRNAGRDTDPRNVPLDGSESMKSEGSGQRRPVRPDPGSTASSPASRHRR